jgi:hypothetical protein
VLRKLNGVEEGGTLRRSPRDRKRTEVGAVTFQSRYVLQEMGVADSVKRVDAEADAGNVALRYVEGGDSAKARHVFLRRAEPRLVAEHQNVGSTVDENDRVRIRFGAKRPVGGAKRFDPDALESVHRRWKVLFG